MILYLLIQFPEINASSRNTKRVVAISIGDLKSIPDRCNIRICQLCEMVWEKLEIKKIIILIAIILKLNKLYLGFRFEGRKLKSI